MTESRRGDRKIRRIRQPAFPWSGFHPAIRMSCLLHVRLKDPRSRFRSLLPGTILVEVGQLVAEQKSEGIQRICSGGGADIVRPLLKSNRFRRWIEPCDTIRDPGTIMDELQLWSRAGITDGTDDS